MGATQQRGSVRSGFTLVELLVVITIIGMLVALISVAAIRARRTAKEAVIVMEIKQLEMAIQAYQEKYGEPPPDFTNAAAVTRHLRKCFPRYNANNWVVDFTAAGITVADLNPGNALVFWLGGGLPDASGAHKLLGFSADPAHPFRTSGSRLPAFFDFDETRLGISGSVYYYRPAGTSIDERAPYVYFRARNKQYNVALPPPPNPTRQEYPFTTADGINEVVIPYAKASYDETGDTWANQGWMNDTSFQIISAGLDGSFGSLYMLPFDASPPFSNPIGATASVTNGEFDNLTNFHGGRLEGLEQ